MPDKIRNEGEPGMMCTIACYAFVLIALILLLALCVVIYCSIPTVQGCGRSEICDSSQSIEGFGYELNLY